MDDDTAELLARRERIEQHPGTIAHRRWRRLADTHDIHQRNLVRAREVLETFQTDIDLAIDVMQNVRPSQHREEFHGQLAQALHNYLASAATLIDHTRNLMRHYNETEFQDEYNQLKEVIASDPKAAFIKELRNYMLHERPLPVVTTMQFDAGEVSHRVCLSREILLRDKWKALAASYLDGLTDDVHLLAVLLHYERLIEDLYTWLFAQFDRIHGAEVAEANELIRAYNLETFGTEGPYLGE